MKLLAHLNGVAEVEPDLLRHDQTAEWIRAQWATYLGRDSLHPPGARDFVPPEQRRSARRADAADDDDEELVEVNGVTVARDRISNLDDDGDDDGGDGDGAGCPAQHANAKTLFRDPVESRTDA